MSIFRGQSRTGTTVSGSIQFFCLVIIHEMASDRISEKSILLMEIWIPSFSSLNHQIAFLPAQHLIQVIWGTATCERWTNTYILRDFVLVSTSSPISELDCLFRSGYHCIAICLVINIHEFTQYWSSLRVAEIGRLLQTKWYHLSSFFGDGWPDRLMYHRFLLLTSLFRVAFFWRHTGKGVKHMGRKLKMRGSKSEECILF